MSKYKLKKSIWLLVTSVALKYDIHKHMHVYVLTVEIIIPIPAWSIF